MIITAFQLDIAWEDKETNFARARDMVAAAQPKPGSLLAFPEMFATGFSMNTPAIAENYNGPTERFLSALASQWKTWVAAGAAMRGPDGKARNKCLVFSPEGTLAAFYAKMRPFTPGGEAGHYAAGEKVCVFDLQGCAVATFVCYDLRFPELFRRAAKLGRPQLYLVVANWPSKRIQHWVRLLQARAIENQAYVMGVNRVGKDPFYDYSGHSLIIDPNGDILADAGDQPGFVSSTLDLGSLANYRQGLPFLDDLRDL